MSVKNRSLNASIPKIKRFNFKKETYGYSNEQISHRKIYITVDVGYSKQKGTRRY